MLNGLNGLGSLGLNEGFSGGLSGLGAFGLAQLGQQTGPADLVALTDFGCKGESCYGRGSVNESLFIKLQKTLNLFAAKARFAPFVTDGLIGPDTVLAAQKVARYIFTTIPAWQSDPVLNQTSTSPSKEYIAMKTPTLQAIFSLALQGQGPAVAEPAPAPTTTTPTTTTALPIRTSALPSSRFQTMTPMQLMPGQPTEPTRLPDIFRLGQQLIEICRKDPNAPQCAQARQACALAASQRFLPADAQTVTAICANLPAPTSSTKSSTKVWWIVGGIAAVVALAGVAFAVTRGPTVKDV